MRKLTPIFALLALVCAGCGSVPRPDIPPDEYRYVIATLQGWIADPSSIEPGDVLDLVVSLGFLDAEDIADVEKVLEAARFFLALLGELPDARIERSPDGRLELVAPGIEAARRRVANDLERERLHQAIREAAGR